MFNKKGNSSLSLVFGMIGLVLAVAVSMFLISKGGLTSFNAEFNTCKGGAWVEESCTFISREKTSLSLKDNPNAHCCVPYSGYEDEFTKWASEVGVVDAEGGFASDEIGVFSLEHDEKPYTLESGDTLELTQGDFIITALNKYQDSDEKTKCELSVYPAKEIASNIIPDTVPLNTKTKESCLLESYFSDTYPLDMGIYLLEFKVLDKRDKTLASINSYLNLTPDDAYYERNAGPGGDEEVIPDPTPLPKES